MKKQINYLALITIILLIIISAAGILSINFLKSYDATNQYGEIIKMYGYGIYAHDSYLKAPILIGTDFCILLVLVPLFIRTFLQDIRKPSTASKLRMMSMFSVSFYYAASISTGVTYNQFHLLYIALFTCSLFGIFSMSRKIDLSNLSFGLTRGIKIFLIMSGVALIIAWMPDIIPSLLSGKPLTLIEVYTTEMTYILDMGIVGPLCLVCLYLLGKKDNLGTLILANIFQLCILVGIMMIPQTICQVLSGFEVTLPVLIGKSGSFIILGVFAIYFNNKLYKKIV